MVSVDEFWVVSERMASLLEDWGLTGYELQPVVHVGSDKNKQPAYQLIPKHLLPPWSKEMRFLYHEGEGIVRCSACNMRARVEFPFHYDRSSLMSLKDFNYTSDWIAGRWVHHQMLVSATFRRLVLENGIARDARYIDIAKTGLKDWFFRPIIVVDR